MTTATPPQSSPQVLVGRTVRMMREAHHIGLRDFAADLGVSPSHLSRIETGERPLTADLEARIVNVLSNLPAPEKSA